MKKNSLKKKKEWIDVVVLSREIDEQIVQMRNEGKSVKEISKTTDRSLASVTYRINKVLKLVNDYKDIKYKE